MPLKKEVCLELKRATGEMMERRPAKHSNPTIGRVNNHAKENGKRLYVVGETDREHAPIPPSTQKHSNCSKTPRF